MAYRRRQGLSRASTFKEEFHQPSSISSSSSPPPDNNNKDSDEKASSSFFSSSHSLAAQAIKASSASRRNPSLSFAFNPSLDHQRPKGYEACGDSGRGDSKSGFWGVLAQKAKSILDDDNSPPKHDNKRQTLKSRSFNTFTGGSAPQPLYQYPESNNGKGDNPTFRKGLDKITSSLNQLGDTFEKAFEEGKTIVESKTADLRTQIRRKGSYGPEDYSNQYSDLRNPWQQSGQTQNLTNHDTQLKASRDVAMATAAKAKLLLRELKTVKADLAFAKARCAQLEEENKMLRDREGTDKGQSREDDDLIRLQLETLLAEKARLASENEIYARENRFLREIVEYHQLTMQDVVYLDEGMEEVTEVYPIDHGNGVSRMLSLSPHSSSPPPPSPDEVILQSTSPPMMTKEIFTVVEEDSKSASEDEAPPSN